MNPQNLKVLSMLKAGPLTGVQALWCIGVYRLSARIYDLRSVGWLIETRMIEVNGKRVGEYYLNRGS